MGQKAHPYGLRLGYIKPWKARWFASKANDVSNYLHEDLKIRKFLKEKLKPAGISNIEIERSRGRTRVRIFAARPGVIIGRRGQEIDKVKEELGALTKTEFFVDIKEVKNPQIDGQLVAENIAVQLEKRIGFRRAMKKAVQLAMTKGALGIKIRCKGRLGGSEIARQEGYHEGKVPLTTLRADVDYGFSEAFTTYGTIGVKVWIYKGDILVKKAAAEERLAREKQREEIELELAQKNLIAKKKAEREAAAADEAGAAVTSQEKTDAPEAPAAESSEEKPS